MASAALVILFRWLHLATAAVAVGGVFYTRIVLPIALRGIAADDPAFRPVVRRARRAFKIVTHTCVLFLLVSGTYNAVLNWPAYTRMGAGLGHGLFGLHLLLGLAALGVLLWQMVAAEPSATHPKWMAVVLGLMLLAIAAASTLKYAREHAQFRALPPDAPIRALLGMPGLRVDRPAATSPSTDGVR